LYKNPRLKIKSSLAPFSLKIIKDDLTEITPSPARLVAKGARLS